MSVGIFCILFLLSAIPGIILLSRGMRGKAHKAGYIIGIVCLASLIFAALCYLALATLLVNGIS